MTVARAIAIPTLGLLGVGAVAGGAVLIADPSGRMMSMPHSLLDHSPFASFLVPGIILLLSNGVLPLLILIAAIRRSRGWGWWVTFQGCVLVGWISVEVWMLRLVVWPHYLYWGIGLLLIVCGLAATREKRSG